MLFFYLLQYILTRITVQGNFGEQELKELQNQAKALQFETKQDNKESDDVVVTEDNMKFKVLKKELLNFLDAMQSREKIKDIQEIMKKHDNAKHESIENRIRNGKITYFVIFSDETANTLEVMKELKDRDIPYILINDKKVADNFKIPFPGVFAYNATEGITYKINLKHSVGTVMAPILSILSTESMKYMDSSKLPVFYMFFNGEESVIRKEFKELALRLREKVKFSMIKFINEQTDLHHFDISQQDLPAMVHVNEDRHKFRLININKKNVEEFVQNFLENKINMFIRTEEVPEKQSNLIVLVGSTHEKFIADRKGDLLVVYGSERCPHCIKLLPTLQSLADNNKDNKNLEIAYINLEKNDVKVRIEAFPTLLLYPKNSDEFIKYNDFDRTENAILKFIQKNGNLNKDIVQVEEEETVDVEKDPVMDVDEAKDEL